MVNRTLPQWLSWISALHSEVIDLSLDRIRQVAQKLEVLQFSCPVITVGGTNGKGSTVATLAAIYNAAGYRCGVYTSPHLLHHNERIVVAGKMVSDAELCEAFQVVEAARGSISLTYFEYSTLAALVLFQKSALDVVILEVGLGGRLDAVNIIDSDVAIVTTVDWDHMDWLGTTLDAIGYEKAGIFRANTPALYGDSEPVMSVINSAKDKNAVLFLRDRDFGYEDAGLDWHWQSKTVHYAHLPKPRVLLSNAALALQAITLLQVQLPLKLEAIQRGLSEVCVPGRFEKIRQQPNCIIDVAHNPQASRMLYQQLSTLGWQGQLHIVFSMLATKDRIASLLPWQECAAKWYLAPLNADNAASLESISADFEAVGITSYQKYGTIGDAYGAALQNAGVAETVLVFGSFHTVAEVLQQDCNYSPTSVGL
ncbi:MAG: bifunctional tetrahydrofolate synthase/dihydrofolate synthase [Gammaproteobacteria bacterium]|nr:bifunctional tetrahydrofolate synthase/dihydrofolate synthase [Gammaproteobacteria bacterium]